jgi:hypothetical protein
MIAILSANKVLLPKEQPKLEALTGAAAVEMN